MKSSDTWWDWVSAVPDSQFGGWILAGLTYKTSRCIVDVYTPILDGKVPLAKTKSATLISVRD